MSIHSLKNRLQTRYVMVVLAAVLVTIAAIGARSVLLGKPPVEKDNIGLDGAPVELPDAFASQPTGASDDTAPGLRVAETEPATEDNDEAPAEPDDEDPLDRAERQHHEEAITEQWPEISEADSAEMTDERCADLMVEMVHAYSDCMVEQKDPEAFAARVADKLGELGVAEAVFQDYMAQLAHDAGRRDKIREAVLKRLQDEIKPGEGPETVRKFNEQVLRDLGFDPDNPTPPQTIPEGR